MPFQFKNKKILIISPEAWGNNHVSKHHYARALAELGAKVWFLNPPSNEFKKIKIQENLEVIHYKASFRGIGILPRFLAAWLTKWELNKIFSFMGEKPDVLWNFDSSRFFELSSIKNMLKIQHIVDLTMDFYRDRGAQTSDFCFATTDFILKEQQKFNQNAFKIHHGFHSLQHSNKSVEIPGNQKIKAMYVGNLAIKYIDWEKLFICADQNPTVDFVMFGPLSASNIASDNKQVEDPNFLKMKQLSNVYFPGPAKPEDIPTYLEKADVLLLCYQAEKFREQLASPHKMMEYLGSGKIIVATYTDEYKDKTDLLCMTKSNEEYPSLFSQVLTNLEKYNQLENQEKRKKFASDHTYFNQILKIEKIIQEKGF